MKLSELATNVARSTQAAVRDFCTEYGRERGLAIFARKVGVTPRRARSLAEGTAGRIDAAEYLATQQARADLLKARILASQQHLQEIEGALHGLDLDAGRGGSDRLGIEAAESGRLVLGARSPAHRSAA